MANSYTRTLVETTAAMSLIPKPAGVLAKHTSTHSYDPGLQFHWSYRLSENWTAGEQLASYWPSVAGKHTFIGESTFLFERQLAKRWDAFVEYAGDFPERGGPRHLLHFGSTYKLAPRHQVDFHICRGSSGAAPGSFVGIGYSFLIRVAK